MLRAPLPRSIWFRVRFATTGRPARSAMNRKSLFTFTEEHASRSDCITWSRSVRRFSSRKKKGEEERCQPPKIGNLESSPDLEWHLFLTPRGIEGLPAAEGPHRAASGAAARRHPARLIGGIRAAEPPPPLWLRLSRWKPAAAASCGAPPWRRSALGAAAPRGFPCPVRRTPRPLPLRSAGPRALGSDVERLQRSNRSPAAAWHPAAVGDGIRPPRRSPGGNARAVYSKCVPASFAPLAAVLAPKFLKKPVRFDDIQWRRCISLGRVVYR